MFARTYFPARYFAPRYWPCGVDVIGPGICATGSAFVPGASLGACYNAGAFEGGVFVPMITMVGGYVAGANEGSVYVPGASAGDDY